MQEMYEDEDIGLEVPEFLASLGASAIEIQKICSDPRTYVAAERYLIMEKNKAAAANRTLGVNGK